MTQPELTTRERYRGCLLAGACGDALGAPVEFMTLEEIRKRYGAKGLTGYAPAHGRIGTVSDDTQMSLFTAEGLLRAVVRYKLLGVSSVEECVNHAYMRWLLTQGFKSRCEGVGTDGWLFQLPELHATRAPGNTCISALSAKTGIHDLYADNDSKGNGGVMRVAPVGLMFGGAIREGDIQKAFDVGCQTARLTHGHGCGYLAAGAMAAIVAQLVAGKNLLQALAAVDSLFIESLVAFDVAGLEVRQALTFARVYAASQKITPDEAIQQLGGGWVAEEALALAVYCCLRCSTLEHALVMAINIEGDSDSVGAITGNLAGALYGVSAIPAQWLERLELREVIHTVADDLYDCSTWVLNPHEGTPEKESILQRYPGW